MRVISLAVCPCWKQADVKNEGFSQRTISCRWIFFFRQRVIPLAFSNDNGMKLQYKNRCCCYKITSFTTFSFFISVYKGFLLMQEAINLSIILDFLIPLIHYIQFLRKNLRIPISKYHQNLALPPPAELQLSSSSHHFSPRYCSSLQ